MDEVGYIPFSKEGAELIFQVLAEPHERGSLIITTNPGFADWTKIFGDPVMTAALLDRLTHRAYIINCTWESYRLKETLKKRPLAQKEVIAEQPSVICRGGSALASLAGPELLRAPSGRPPWARVVKIELSQMVNFRLSLPRNS